MGATFLRTMNIPELVAKSRSDYVRTAVRLWSDKKFYTAIVEKIRTRLDVVWEDMEYSYSWYQLLSRSVGLPSLTWIDYITQTGRDVTYETKMRVERTANRESFDRVWGTEEWLLERGVAVLDSHLSFDQVPRVFNDWKSNNNTTTHTANVTDTDTATTTHTTTAIHTDTPTQTHTDMDTPTHTPTHTHKHTGAHADRFTVQFAASDTTTTADTARHTTADISYTPPTDITIANIDTVINNLSDVSTHKSALTLMRRLANSYHLIESYRLGMAILGTGKYQLDPQFLLDLGYLSHYRGEYESAFEYCTQALVLVPESILVLQCIGVAGMYAPGKIIPAVAAFTKSAEQLERMYDVNQNIENDAPNKMTNDNTNITNNHITKNGNELTCEVCKYSKDAILTNLLSALFNAGEHAEASRIICRVTDLPLMEYGGTVHFTVCYANCCKILSATSSKICY